MFPKASLTGRVVRPNNTMRMAKSWGHHGGPVLPSMCCFAVATSSASATAKRMARELKRGRALQAWTGRLTVAVVKQDRDLLEVLAFTRSSQFSSEMNLRSSAGFPNRDINSVARLE